LVRAFAARNGEEVAPENRLPRPWNRRRTTHQVHVDRADDDDGFHQKELFIRCYSSSTYRGSSGAASALIAAMSCSPYCFTLYGPMPLICSSLASESGAALAIDLSVVSWQMQYGGGLWSRSRGRASPDSSRRCSIAITRLVVCARSSP